MSESFSQFEQRKKDHIKLALMQENQSNAQHSWNQINLVHEALPDLNFKDISIKTHYLNQDSNNPFFISSMTAGHAQAPIINRNLIAACAQSHWAMGVGSQRRELNDPDAGTEWKQLRREFPQVKLYSNLGIAQLIHTSSKSILKITDSIQAHALIIHCNPLQECIQPEGTTDYKGCWQALEKLVKESTIPIIIKETGCGFSNVTIKKLENVGIAALDISGYGGTHWGRIEGMRAQDDLIRHRAAETFSHWGINTATAVREAIKLNPTFEIWGSGGIHNGLNAAKLLALGVKAIGFAKPMLEGALINSDAVLLAMQTIEYELKTAMFCTGSAVIQELQNKVNLAPLNGEA